MTNQEAIEFLKNMIDREAIGFVCPEREGDVAIWQYHVEALQMAISALQAQEAKAQLSAEGTTSDLISRQAAIDRINKQREHLQPGIYPQDKIGDAAYRICAEFIERLPSAQPEIEERTEEFAQNVPKEDLISRKAAIDYCYQLINVEHQQGSDEMNYGQERVNQTEAILHHIEFMPPAQPDVPDTNVGKMDGDELDEAIRHCDEIVQDITWFCNSPSKYIEQRRHESAVKLRQLASWLRELKRLKSEKEKMIDALSEKMCYMNTCPNERDAILRIVGGTTNCENHCNADCNNTNCESYRYGGRDERTD